MGPIQTLSQVRAHCGQILAARLIGLEHCHKIWLAVGINGSWKGLFLALLFSRGLILLSFLLFYGFIVGKYALICAMEIQKIQMVVHIFSGFALFTKLMSVSQSWISLQVVDRVQCVEYAFWFTSKRVQIKILSILKLFYFKGLAWNDFSERGTQAEAHCERNLNRQLWSIRQKILHCCSRNFCRHYYKLVALVTDLLLAFAFCKK